MSISAPVNNFLGIGGSTHPLVMIKPCRCVGIASNIITNTVNAALTFTVQKDVANTSLAQALTTSGTGVTITTGSIAFDVGDRLGVKLTGGGTAGAITGSFSILLE